MLSIVWMTVSCFSSPKIKGNGRLVTQQIPAGDYTEIRVEGASEIKITYSQAEADPEVKVTVDENIFSTYDFTVSKSCLTIRPKAEYRHSRFAPTRFDVTASSKTLEKVSITGDHTFTVATPLHSETLNLGITGNGKITASEAEGTNLHVGITGSGQASLGGRIETASVGITGNGRLQAYDLQVEDMQCDITGSGRVETFVNGRLKVNITGSGRVHYKGSTQRVNFHGTGTGKVVKED
jgi:hypothetical protein